VRRFFSSLTIEEHQRPYRRSGALRRVVGDVLHEVCQHNSAAPALVTMRTKNRVLSACSCSCGRSDGGERGWLSRPDEARPLRHVDHREWFDLQQLQQAVPGPCADEADAQRQLAQGMKPECSAPPHAIAAPDRKIRLGLWERAERHLGGAHSLDSAPSAASVLIALAQQQRLRTSWRQVRPRSGVYLLIRSRALRNLLRVLSARTEAAFVRRRFRRSATAARTFCDSSSAGPGIDVPARRSALVLAPVISSFLDSCLLMPSPGTITAEPSCAPSAWWPPCLEGFSSDLLSAADLRPS